MKDIARYNHLGARDEAARAAKAVESAKSSRKGGKHYAHRRRYMMTGIPHLKAVVRSMHSRIYSKYKRFIDPKGLTCIHHEWLNDGTANYRGVALVEKEQHMYGYIDVIQILDGKITLLTEKEVSDK